MMNYLYIIVVFLVTNIYGQNDRWLLGRLVTEQNNVKTPINNTIVTILTTGDKDKTDENGKFRIKLKESLSPGDNISITVEKKGWAILYPLSGKTYIPKNLEIDLIEILILPIESKKFFSHDHLEKLILNLMANNQKTVDIKELPQKNNLPDNIKEWAEYYHLTVEDVNQKIEEWTKELEKNKEDDYKLGLAAFVKGNYNKAGNYFHNSAINKVEILNKLNEKENKIIDEIIRDFQKAGESYSEIQNYKQAIIAYENALKYIDKNLKHEIWIELMMDRAFSLTQQILKNSGPDLLKSINSTIEIYDSILSTHKEKDIDSALILRSKSAIFLQKANFQKGNKSIANYKTGLKLLKESQKIYQKENNKYGMGAVSTNIMFALGHLALSSNIDSIFYFFFKGLKFGKEALKGLDNSDWEITVPKINIAVINLYTRSLTNEDPFKRTLSTTLRDSQQLNVIQKSWLPILKRLESLIYFDSLQTYLIKNPISSDIDILNEAIIRLIKEERQRELSNARNNFAYALVQKSFSLNYPANNNILQKAIDTLQMNFSYLTNETYPQDWARTKLTIGIIKIICSQIQEKSESKNSLQEAITIFDEVFEIFEEDYFPNGFAETQIYQGIAYKKLALLEDEINRMLYLSVALKSLSAASRVFTQEFNPLKWLEIQYNLSEVYFLFGDNNKSQDIINETQKVLFP
ncbi:MAG: hypothetical protein IPM32_03785 [Ignavibacteriae bacterium]|nr:hypothetical protein [Ignavibacteriota bacterium]